MTDTRNPHVGAPFTDDDAAIAAALDDVSVPVLLCSLVHMTGDPSWIRDVSLPGMPGTMDLQSGLDDDVLADLRRRAVPAIAAYRDGGCVPHELPDDLVVEMFAFLAGEAARRAGHGADVRRGHAVRRRRQRRDRVGRRGVGRGQGGGAGRRDRLRACRASSPASA